MSNRKFYDQIDKPLSALALNCCQLSCCLPDRQSYCSFQSTGEGADWMKQLVEANPNIKLRDVVLPGTHDSASYTIPKMALFSASARTQNLTVEQQLMAGARYLDIRVATKSESETKLSIWHGCLEGGDLDVVLQQVNDFLATHPGEFIVLELVPEYGREFGGKQKRMCLRKTKELLAEKTAPGGPELRDILVNKTLKEVVGVKHQVAVLLHERFYSDDLGMSAEEVREQYGFVENTLFIRNPWHNTRDVDDLLKKNMAAIEENGSDKKKWMCNQFLLTPGAPGMTGIVGALIGSNSLRPVSGACKLYGSGVLDHFLRQNVDLEWNIVSLDFMDLCPDLVDFLISLNWTTSDMQIHVAAASTTGGGTKDVTEKIQAYICRGSVLFLIDESEDLALDESSFVLIIGYSFNSKYYVLTIDCNCDCPLLVSLYSRNEDADNVEIESGSTVFVKRGAVYANKEDIKDRSGVVIKCTHNGHECEFEIV